MRCSSGDHDDGWLEARVVGSGDDWKYIPYNHVEPIKTDGEPSIPTSGPPTSAPPPVPSFTERSTTAAETREPSRFKVLFDYNNTDKTYGNVKEGDILESR